MRSDRIRTTARTALLAIVAAGLLVTPALANGTDRAECKQTRLKVRTAQGPVDLRLSSRVDIPLDLRLHKALTGARLEAHRALRAHERQVARALADVKIDGEWTTLKGIVWDADRRAASSHPFSGAIGALIAAAKFPGETAVFAKTIFIEVIKVVPRVLRAVL